MSQISQITQSLQNESTNVGDTTSSSRRLSIRRVAMLYGIPARTVARAIAAGQLLAAQTTTETGRVRFYVSTNDAKEWFYSLHGTDLDRTESVL